MFGLGWLRPGDAPEQVPSDALKGIGPAPGYQVQVIADPEERDKFLRQHGVAANDSYNGHRIEAGVVPSMGLVVLPPDASPELTDHENLHSYNVQHDDGGRGWELTGAPPAGIDPRITQALLALPKSPTFQTAQQPLTYDWGNAFAQSSPGAPSPKATRLAAAISNPPPSEPGA
jgi:hypothetical protein